MSGDLVEISIVKLAILRDKYKVERPKHIVAFALIDNLICRFSKFPESKENAKIYSLNDDWESDGTFVVVLVRNKFCHIQ